MPGDPEVGFENERLGKVQDAFGEAIHRFGMAYSDYASRLDYGNMCLQKLVGREVDLSGCTVMTHGFSADSLTGKVVAVSVYPSDRQGKPCPTIILSLDREGMQGTQGGIGVLRLSIWFDDLSKVVVK